MLAFLQNAAMDDPRWLALLVFPFAILLMRWVRPHGSHYPLPHSAFAWIPPTNGVHTMMPRLRILLRTAALSCLVPIIAGFGAANTESDEEQKSGALMLALDVSSSMSADDFAPGNRLTQARFQLEKFTLGLPDIAVGLLRFAAVPELLTPVTRDREAVTTALTRIEPAGFGEDGTAIGSAIASAASRLRGNPSPSRRILLLTDGVSNRGSISPADAARIARSLGISLDIIGIGTGQISRFWIPSEEGAALEVEARIAIDDASLEELCAIAGGRYLRVRSPEELREALDSLYPAAAARGAAAADVAGTPAAVVFAWLALTLLATEFALGAFLFPEIPG